MEADGFLHIKKRYMNSANSEAWVHVSQLISRTTGIDSQIWCFLNYPWKRAEKLLLMDG